MNADGERSTLASSVNGGTPEKGWTVYLAVGTLLAAGRSALNTGGGSAAGAACESGEALATLDFSLRTGEVFMFVPLLAEQRGPYIVGTTDDRTFCLLWNCVIQLPYLATHEAFNTLCHSSDTLSGMTREDPHWLVPVWCCTGTKKVLACSRKGHSRPAGLWEQPALLALR